MAIQDSYREVAIFMGVWECTQKFQCIPKACNTARDLVRYQQNLNVEYHEVINAAHGLQINGEFIEGIYIRGNLQSD
jgi:Ni,Fe-hydrogenase I small subunit